MSRIRILQIVAGLDVGHAFGGAERSGLELARALDTAQFDVTVCGFWRCDTPTEKSWQAVLEAAGIPVFFATASGARRNSMDFFAGAKRIVDECRARQIHITHAHHEGGALAALWAKVRGGAQAAMRTAYVPFPEEWGHGLVNAALRGVFSHYIFPRQLDVEVSVSADHQRQLAARKFSRQQTNLIYNTQPLHRREPHLRSAAVIGSVGRLVPQKGHIDLIEAMPHVLRVVPDAQLLIVGEGELRPMLLQRADALGVRSHIQLTGQRDNVSALLDEMSVFAMPSRWEGVPHAFLEAVAGGLPVIVTNIPGFAEFIAPERSGWLVQRGNISALANALIDALQQPQRALAYARQAQQDILPQFSMQAISRQYEGIYARLYDSVARP